MAERKELVGAWLRQGKAVVRDAVCLTIEDLVQNRFRRVATREGGWTVLFQDPEDGLYWELSYPDGQMHGGGPPKLSPIEKRDVSERYPDLQE